MVTVCLGESVGAELIILERTVPTASLQPTAVSTYIHGYYEN